MFSSAGDFDEAHAVALNPIPGGCLPQDVVAFYDFKRLFSLRKGFSLCFESWKISCLMSFIVLRYGDVC